MTRPQKIWLTVAATLAAASCLTLHRGVDLMSNPATLSTENSRKGAELFFVGFIGLGASVLPLKAADCA